MATPTPSVLGRYEIESELGRGMMGVVYRARDPALGRTVALKVVQPALPIEEAARQRLEERFLREASLAAGLSHPSIVVVHDVGRDAATQSPFMALEYLEGATLAAVLAGGERLDWRKALGIGASLADALHHAHGRGVFHRDVKPSNIMLLPSGQPKILDFGIAKAAVSDLTAAGEFWGSPAYMSPEQASGYVVDGRSDIFSLGSVLYELLAGRRAFEGKSIVEIMHHVVNDDPPTLSSVRPGLPPALDGLLARALAKDPADRYADGRGLAEAIGAVLRADVRDAMSNAAVSTGTFASPRPAQAPRRPTASRDRRLWLGLGLAVVSAIAAFSLNSGSGSRPAPVAVPVTAASAAPMALASPAASPVVAPVLAALPTPPPVALRVAPAQLALSIEHSVKEGRLRLWIDNALELDKPLARAETRKVLFLKRRSDRLAMVLVLAPGRRQLRFEVEGDDGTRFKTLLGEFKSGEGRSLKVKVGGTIEAEWLP